MEVVNLQSWEDFQRQLDALQEYRRHLSPDSSTYISPFLFRGQSNSEWSLTTTLERYIDGSMSLGDYYRVVSAIKAQVETYTDKTWNILTYPKYCDWLENADTFLGGEFPAYEYMIYLRHHGFPSPLLDWTRSPYIAAYFAFENINSPTQQVSIYAYLENVGQGKYMSSDQPYIMGLGPYVRSHRRHFLQQSEYTICLKSDNNSRYYACHEDVIASPEHNQDMLWKLNIPVSEKWEALKHLESVNINLFSLFGSEESLMSTLALSEFHLKAKNP